MLRFPTQHSPNSVQIGIRDGVTGHFKLVPREQAVVSVFDSNFLIGDGIWVRVPLLRVCGH